MLSPNLHESELIQKKFDNSCKLGTPQELRDCQNCRYRHKGICDAFFGHNSYHSNIDNLQRIEKRLVLRENSRIDLEPALNLKDLFYDIENNFEPVLNLKSLFYERRNKVEPVLNLKNLFYELEVKNYVENTTEILRRKAKYENFKLLTDIQRVLENCTHLTSKEKALYCQSQRYFMKLFLREINKPD